MYQVNNLPKNYREKKFIVVKDLRENESIPKNQRGFWFWGSYNDLVAAQQVQKELYSDSIKVLILESSDVYPSLYGRN